MTQRVERGQDQTRGLPKKRQFPLEARRHISLGKGGTWVAIEKYAQWGMFAKEIIAVVLLKEKRVLSAKQVGNARENAMRRGDLSRPTGAIRREAFRVAHQDEEEIQKRVILWLEVENIFAERGLEEIPTRRDDWLLLIRYYQARKEMGMTGNNGAMTAFRIEFDNLLPETQERILPWIFMIRDVTQAGPNVDPTKLAGAMAQPAELTPAERRHARR